MKLPRPQFTTGSMLWLVTLVAFALGTYVVHRDAALQYDRGLRDGREEVRTGELADMLAQRNGLQDEVEQLREYNLKIVSQQFNVWREKK